ncbi:IgA peptidase M64-domain-containing protein [Trametes elegans]|nr:IgA peptidase M64-domain-containing protein [Trametes elegans]
MALLATSALSGALAQFQPHKRLADVDLPQFEVTPLITSGKSSNRVDLTFFADGYTAEEKDKFLEDALRLATDVSSNQTFYTVQPLLNFWAAFAPSNESGIGVGGQPKDTVFGLYRDGTELRGIYPKKEDVVRAARDSLGDRCDYQILVGNDPLYGGLGGEVTIITPSQINGLTILRHELGHSIIDVGEEYDGGFVYFGVNTAHNTTLSAIPWAHWLSNASQAPTVRVERSVMPLQAYPWTLLNTSAPWSARFSSSGTYASHAVSFSLAGVPDADELRVELDGADLGWVPRADIGVDRWFYVTQIGRGLAGGEHEIRFTLRDPRHEGQAQLCSLEVIEYGSEDEFVATPGYYGLYTTYSTDNNVTYRPTNDDCVMRNVTKPNFCKICMEGLWHSLLRRVDLIDGLESRCEQDAAGNWTRTFDLSLAPLANNRKNPVDVQESYTITWLKDGIVLDAFANKTTLVDDGGATGDYVVNVQYTTEEVRVDPDGLLRANANSSVSTGCGQ